MVYASDVLSDIEEKFNLFDMEISGFKSWWMSRYKVYEMLDTCLRNLNSKESINPTKKGFLKDSSKLMYLKSLNFKKNSYKKSDIVCISGVNMRREKVNGKAFDIIFDYIGKYDKNNSYIILNTLSGTGFQKETYTKDCYNMANLTFRNLVHRKMWKNIISKEDKQKINNIFNEVEEYLKIKYNINVNLKDEVGKQGAVLVKEFKNARTILNKINPKVLYVECAYSPTHLIFIYAAKDLNIPVVEYQHGLINKRHVGYIYNKELEKSDPVPDCLCLYGKYFEDMVREMNPQNNLKIVQYGYPFLYEQLINKEEEEKVYEYLITTQGAAYSNYWVEFIKELLKCDKEGKILMKVHPNEIMEYESLYKDIINEERVVFSKGMNVYDCFKVCKRHLSCFSTCHYESLTYDLPTYVIQFPGWHHVEHLKNYNVKFFAKASDLKKYLNECSEKEILFHRFQKEFFNIEKDNLNYQFLKQKVVTENNKLVKL